ncbi:MAG: PqqD family protein [Pseudomonadota bacterium]
MKNNDKFKKSRGIIQRPVGDEILLFNQDGSKVLTLNATSTLIWKACTGNNTLDEIAEELKTRYEVNKKQALIDIKKIVSELENQDLVRKA